MNLSTKARLRICLGLVCCLAVGTVPLTNAFCVPQTQFSCEQKQGFGHQHTNNDIRLMSPILSRWHKHGNYPDTRASTNTCHQRGLKSFVSDSSDTGSSDLGNGEEIIDPKFLHRHKYWVVLVDDEEAIRLSVGDLLYDEGYQVSACADADALFELVYGSPPGAGAHTMAPTKLPDAIVSDIRMPGKDGIELLGLIRQDDRLQRIPVILLTAKALTTDRIVGFKAGADAYLPKPFDPDELLSILDNAILRRQQLKSAQGDLVELKDEMRVIKSIMKRNSAKYVKQTDVYLTPAERDVLELLSKGYTNKEIAAEREVSTDRVVKIIQKLYSKTETRTRTQLVRWAFQTGYVSSST